MAKKNYAYVNKEMLIWARGTTPFKTLEELEFQFPQFKAEKIKKWENGEEYPSVNEAKELAKKYKLPFACFYLSNPPEKKPREYTDRRTFSGTVYDEISYELWKEIKRIKEDRETLLEFSSGEENIINLSFPTVEENTSITEIATIIRSFLELPNGFRTKSEFNGNSFNYFRLKLEAKGIIVAQISEVDLSEMKGLSIFYDKFPIVAINNKDYERAKTFSIFHEVAHLIRRSSSLCLINFDDRNDDEEKLCDKIAAEILMPTELFKDVAIEVYSQFNEWSSLALSKLADRFGVSTISAFLRLFDLGLITRNYFNKRYNEIVEEFNSIVDRLNKARAGKNIPLYYAKYINAHGHLMPRSIISSYYSGKISLGETCKILNINTKHFSKIAKAVMVL